LKQFRHKKSLGQHFLVNDAIAKAIVDAFYGACTCNDILEIGPGHGVLTKHLLAKTGKNIYASEIDERIIAYLHQDLGFPPERVIEGDFLQADLEQLLPERYGIIGNFPYNISSQILFKMLEHKDNIPVLAGMFQKEMAKRVASPHGSKDYGVITVLVQAYYDVAFLFEIAPQEFDPPPKVFSAVILLTRKNETPDWDEELLRLVVKTAFNQRRKKLSNALSLIPQLKEILIQYNFADKRAEQLTVADFISLAKSLE